MLGDDVGVLDESGNLHFPKVSTASISLPPVVSITNPKKRPRTDGVFGASAPVSAQTLSSPVVDAATAAKKRKLKDEDASEDLKSPSKKDKKDKKEKHKDKKEKHKDKKEKSKERSKEKSK